ncbi:MAG: RNA polymerase sigma factor [Bacteroidales bacterium]|jgi:RNA polymerase sigma-70 factor (ECF subfamily)|nr:RNA polymerase sigma factor [Bacteroidales bacterium]
MTYNGLTDEQLVSLALNGDRQAFSEIVERYRRMVARTVKGMLGDNVYAEDIGQDVFVRLYNSLSEFRGEAKLATYINKIAVNLTLNEIKRRKRSSGVFVNDSQLQDTLYDVTDENDHDRRDTKEIIGRALAKLEPGFRAVVVMRMLEGYSTKETAEVLGIPMGTVLSRLSRAQEQLKMIIQEYR